MTSVICWLNHDEVLDGVWAISDSRVSGHGGVLTENCPKLTVIRANAYETGDFLRQRPRQVISFGFGFAGSTLIASNVKEMLSALIGDLHEIHYFDAPNTEFEARVPTLAEIADVTKKLAERFVASIGVYHPTSARCEIIIFGFCRRSFAFKVFKIWNSPDSPAQLRVEDMPVSDRQMVILGDKKALIEEGIKSKRDQFKIGSVNWQRAPIMVLSNILGANQLCSIGGSLQLCAAFRDGVRLLPISSPGTYRFVGFDLFREIECIGGFTPSLSLGLTAPGPDGWPTK